LPVIVRGARDIDVLCCEAPKRFPLGNGNGIALLGLKWNASLIVTFLPERDYATFGSLLSQFRLSVCRLSETLVHPIQGVEPFGKVS